MMLNLSTETFETIVAAVDCAIGIYKEEANKNYPARIKQQFAAQAIDAEQALFVLEGFR